jgi:hypothetical protein
MLMRHLVRAIKVELVVFREGIERTTVMSYESARLHAPRGREDGKLEIQGFLHRIVHVRGGPGSSSVEVITNPARAMVNSVGVICGIPNIGVTKSDVLYELPLHHLPHIRNGYKVFFLGGNEMDEATPPRFLQCT